MNKIIDKIEKEIKFSLKNVSETKTNQLVSEIIKAKKVFVTGQGRSGLISESFAMRLMQLGIKTYHIGDCTTPSITKNDILIAISGSGTTEITSMIIKEANKANAKIVLLTTKKTTAEKAKLKNISLFIEIAAKSKKETKKSSIEPLGTLFEQASLLYLDSVVILLMKKLKIKEKELGKRHANLE